MASRESPDPSSHRPTDYDDVVDAVLHDLDDDDMLHDHEVDDDDDEDHEFYTLDGDEDEEEEEDEDEDDEVEDDEDGDAEFHDADDGGTTGVQIELTLDDETEEATDVRAVGSDGRPVNISRAQLLQILANPQIRNLLQGARSSGGETDEDDDDDEMYMTGRRRRPPRGTRVELPPVPNPNGKELQMGGVFGISEPFQDRLRRRKKKLARRIMQRELGPDHRAIRRENRLASQDMIPGTEADTIIHYEQRCYSGQFADDGNFFFTCSQDFNVRMYDTSNPTEWKYYKSVHYPYGQWTLTDASLSRDNKFIAFSSIRSVVCLATTDPDSSDSPYNLDFSDMVGVGSNGPRRRGGAGHSRHFGIWSIRFSGDGREIVAGTSEYAVYVYDIEAGRSILRIPGHEDDVNAVCFGDKSSPHILYSGSDDSLIKVWDRRSMGDSREAGVFMGHTEGLTYVDSKGDGRYVLSNGKDQSMKLWDLRMMMSTEKASTIPRDYMSGFDYRFMNFTDDDYRQHPHDCSVVTFRGHSVLKTLIRCHFSPPGSTDSRYVYSGSEDGKVYVYNMDATLAAKIDVNTATRHSRPRDPSVSQASIFIDDRHGRGPWKTCVRDASWHPSAPVIAATSWNGYGMSTGTCTIHSWNDGADADESELGMSRRVNHQLVRQPQYYQNTQPNPSAQRPTRRRGLLSRLIGRVDDAEDEQW